MQNTKIYSRQEIEEKLDSIQLPDDLTAKVNSLLTNVVARNCKAVLIAFGKDGMCDAKYGHALLKALKSSGYKNADIVQNGVWIVLKDDDKAPEFEAGPTIHSDDRLSIFGRLKRH